MMKKCETVETLKCPEKKKQFFMTLYNLKKPPPRNVRRAVLKNFRKLPRLLF